MLPETSPTLLDTLATTGGKPNASSVGKGISGPDPTTALMGPAPTPGGRMVGAPTRHPVRARLRRRPPRQASGQLRGARHPPGRPALNQQRDAEALGQIPLG